ncbi:MAG: hypothetical protein WA555_13480 [Candidatus Sulfotelmatobacter sp.]
MNPIAARAMAAIIHAAHMLTASCAVDADVAHEHFSGPFQM